MLYLASTSPRRRRLLTDAGIAYECVPPGLEPVGDGDAIRLALCRAEAKAIGARVQGPAGLVLGVDTVVELDGREFGKPQDRDDAARMLEELGGREHSVHTAHCLRTHPDDRRRWRRVTSARVRFEPVDAPRLARYLDSTAWDGKAGAYGIQDREADFVHLVDGAWDTVVGLSVAAVRDLVDAAERGAPA